MNGAPDPSTGSEITPQTADAVTVQSGTIQYRWLAGSWVKDDIASARKEMVFGETVELLDEIRRLRSDLRFAQFKVDILTNNEAVHLARLRKVDPEWVAAEARVAEDEAWWEANGKAELIAHLREQGLTLASEDTP